jgi:prepilin-type N-terminal cleavage/methylation domain-containing protein
MKQAQQKLGRPFPRTEAGMTLVEVVVALAISGLAVGAIVSGYLFSATSAEKSGLSLAANARAMERLEETRSATWDTASVPAVDMLVASTFPNKVMTLDVSGTGSGITYATNFTQITLVSTSPPLKRIRVDCVWNFKGSKLLTNTIETCRAPDQ